MRRVTPLLGIVAVLVSVLAPATSASARLTEEYTYSYDQLWRAAVRMIAVDFRYPISDRDEEIGYLLFSYEEHGQEHHGSLELVRTEGAHGTPQVRVTLQVASMPTYVERMMLDRFTRKLGADYGQPPPSRRPVAPPPPVTDDEADEDSEEDDGQP